jgi:hypothetical protein
MFTILEIISVISPFFPISNPNEKSLSPCTKEISTIKKDMIGLTKYPDIIEEQDSKQYLDIKTPTQTFNISQFKDSKENNINILSKDGSFTNICKQRSYIKTEDLSIITSDEIFLTKKDSNSCKLKQFKKFKKFKIILILLHFL